MITIDGIKDCGVVGAGGAGFPTHVKLNAKADTFIVNGIECEPLLETDKFLMRSDAKALVLGTHQMGDLLKAKRKVIAVKSKNKKEIKALKDAVAETGLEVEIFTVGNYYPAGDEQMLLKEVLGVTLVPGSIPLSQGAVVSNVATVLDVFSKAAVTHRLVTVTGAVKRPLLLKVPIGTSISACIEKAGGATLKPYGVILGGPMMGKHIQMHETMDAVVTKTLGGIIVLPEDHLLFEKKKLSMDTIIRRATSACIQCRMCTDLCPRYLNGHPLYPHKVMRGIANSEKQFVVYESAQLCCECGVCELYACPMGLSPKTVNQFVKTEMAKAGYKKTYDNEADYQAHEMRPYRLLPTDRLIKRLALTPFVSHQEMPLLSFEPGEVTIPLKQHIGMPAVPIVFDGEWVEKGQRIASAVEGALGAHVHSSIAGKVRLIKDAVVVTRIGEGEGK